MSVPKDIQDFVENYYNASDDPNPENYVSLFTPDADFVVGEITAKGQDGIRKVRDASWPNFTYRVHKHEKLYYNENEPDVALATGTIDYDRIDGVKVRDLSWAARLIFDRSNGLKVKDYYVWVVSGGASMTLWLC